MVRIWTSLSISKKLVIRVWRGAKAILFNCRWFLYARVLLSILVGGMNGEMNGGVLLSGIGKIILIESVSYDTVLTFDVREALFNCAKLENSPSSILQFVIPPNSECFLYPYQFR